MSLPWKIIAFPQASELKQFLKKGLNILYLFIIHIYFFLQSTIFGVTACSAFHQLTVQLTSAATVSEPE